MHGWRKLSPMRVGRGAWLNQAALLLLLCCCLVAGTEEGEYVRLLRRSRRLAAAAATPYSRLRLGIDKPTLYGYGELFW